jgi:hypothetical protein
MADQDVQQVDELAVLFVDRGNACLEVLVPGARPCVMS